MENRGINFGAGPAALPEEILKEAQKALWNWNNQGMSILEIGHRTEPVKTMMREAEEDLKNLLNIPSNYHVLFLGGSARAQFSMIPMNLLRENTKADYLVTGTWSELAYREAQKYGEPNLVIPYQETPTLHIPQEKEWQLNPDAAYFYYTSNETLTGLQFHDIPHAPQNVPLVVDMTSDFLSHTLDISKFGLIFAGAQKNIAPAGLTLVIVRDNLLLQAQTNTPCVYHYALQAEQHSLYNTPPVFQIYMASRMFAWIKRQGGLKAIEEYSRIKSSLLYECIDNSALYRNNMPKAYRSHMNVSFTMPTLELEKEFLFQAQKEGLLALKGHAIMGGLRASLYNAISIENVTTLVNFMKKFEKINA